MMRKYQVRFGGGRLEKGYMHLARRLPNLNILKRALESAWTEPSGANVGTGSCVA